jgi:ferric iron reductase protein FhuF
MTIEFQEGDRGKTFWYAVCWENNRGKKGPWSSIESVVIP